MAAVLIVLVSGMWDESIYPCCLLTGCAEDRIITVMSSADDGDAGYRVEEYENCVDEDFDPARFKSCKEVG